MTIASQTDLIRRLAEYDNDVLLAAVAYKAAGSAKDMIEDMSHDPEWMAENKITRDLVKDQAVTMIVILPDMVAESQDVKYYTPGNPNPHDVTKLLIEISNELIDACPELRRLTVYL
jgi:hypothetical protein